MIPTDSGGGDPTTPEIDPVGSVSFQVAPGDPDAIDGAAVWHEQVSTQLASHAQAVSTASADALSQWQGDAASSYADLSSQMHAALKAGEVRAGDTAATMHSIAKQLDHFQQVGKAAMREAQQYVEKAIKDHARAVSLKSQLAQAKQDLQNAISSANPGMDAHTGINPYLNGTPTAVTSAQGKVTQLQNELTQAVNDLKQDNTQIKQCDQRGQQAWEDAEQAVSRFMTIPISPIPAPPMPGVPDFLPPPSHPSFLDKLKNGLEDAGSWILKTGTKVVEEDGKWMLMTATGPVGLTLVETAEGMKLYSKATGQTIGICVGGDVTGPISGGDRVCYIQTPKGGTAITVTTEQGHGVGASVNGYAGIETSNGQVPADQGKGFHNVSASGGEGPYAAGGGYSWGTNSSGQRIVVHDAGWTPGVGAPAGGQYGKSYTWVFKL